MPRPGGHDRGDALSARDFRSALIAGNTAKAAELAKGWQYSGYKMTVFSSTEEKVIEEHILHAKLYFNMVDALQIAGGEVSTVSVDFEPNVIEDRELITGQNPRSDKPLAAQFVQRLSRWQERPLQAGSRDRRSLRYSSTEKTTALWRWQEQR